MDEIPGDLAGWWRIVETSQWEADDLDIMGPALLSLTGEGDRLRMHCLLAYVSARPAKAGVSFTWEGAWELDQLSGTGSVMLGRWATQGEAQDQGRGLEQILEVHNRCIAAQDASIASYEYVALEVPPGVRQVRRDSRTGQLVPRGEVLRCHIEHVGGEDHVSIYIDDEEYSLQEFGEILSMHAGWGMRIAFVPEDEVHVEPVIEVRKPKKGR